VCGMRLRRAEHKIQLKPIAAISGRYYGRSVPNLQSVARRKRRLRPLSSASRSRPTTQRHRRFVTLRLTLILWAIGPSLARRIPHTPPALGPMLFRRDRTRRTPRPAKRHRAGNRRHHREDRSQKVVRKADRPFGIPSAEKWPSMRICGSVAIRTRRPPLRARRAACLANMPRVNPRRP